MKAWAAILLLILLVVPASADLIVQRDSFDDGNLTADPAWEYVKPGSVTISDERATSGAYSLKVSSNNELGAVRTCSGIRTADQAYSCTFDLYVESMGDEAIPWSLQNTSTGGIAAIIFILPGGTVQLFVLDSTTTFSGKSANVPYPLTYGEWHSFRITYDSSSTTNLYLDGHESPDASVSQHYVRDPQLVCIGNFSNPHTSTFYIDDLVFTGSGWDAPARLYIQVCSDTSTGGINVGQRYIDFPELDSTYTTPEGQAARVMSESYRNALRDSLGNPIKFTWYMQTGSLYAAGTDSGALLPYELMEDYHGDAVKRWGDEMAYHYHSWIWSDPNGDGRYYWNQAPDFSYCRDDFDQTMYRMLIDRGFYPSSFRSGWHYMDNEWQRYLDELMPYRFENDWPAYRVDPDEPVDNVYDWRRASSDWVPYHPDPNDYQSPGTLRGWDSRSKYINGATTAILTDAFYKALYGQPQLLTLFSHLKEADFPEQVTALHQRLMALHSSIPLVEFEYLTGRECMLKWRNGADVTPPTVQITTEDSDAIRTAALQFDEEIYQLQPFVARRGADGSYTRLECTPAGPNRWQFEFTPADTLTVAVGATDWFGNPCVQYLRMPLRLTGVEITDVTTTSVTVAWGTNLPADALLECTPLDSGTAQTYSNSTRLLYHRATVGDLTPGTVYRLTISSQDEFGQRVESEAVCFATKGLDPTIIDNLDPGFSVEGTWSTGNTTPGAYGPDYRYVSTSPTGTARAYWTWTVSQTGIYRIQARWSAGANRTTTARYSVTLAGNEYNRVVNQQIDGAQWNTLVVKELTAGQTVTVQLNNIAESGFVVLADSVRFEPAFVDLPSIGVCRTLEDGQDVSITGAVTLVQGSQYYVESLDRSSAICVLGAGVAVGDVVQVAGELSTLGQDRVLTGEYISKTGDTVHLRPFGVLARDAWTMPAMLVTVWGKVLACESGHFDLDDGSSPPGCSPLQGIRVSLPPGTPPVSGCVVATGVVVVQQDENGPVLWLLPRGSLDIQDYLAPAP